MSTFNPGQQQNVIYQADPAVVQHLQGVREALHHSCKPHLNHPVKVHTLDGQVHEGTIAGVDNKHLYLNVTVTADMSRGYYNPYYKPYYPYYPYPNYPGYYPGGYYPGNALLPLVLYDLLAISLL